MICQEKEYMRPAYAVYGTYKDWLIYTEYNGEYVTLKSKNLKTEEEKSLVDDQWVGRVFVHKNLVACTLPEDSDQGIMEINLETGEKVRVTSKGDIGDVFWTDKIKLYITYDYDKDGNTRFQVYRYNNGDVEQIQEGDSDACFVPYVLYKDMLIGRLGYSGLACIDKKDFLDGKMNWRIVAEEQS